MPDHLGLGERLDLAPSDTTAHALRRRENMGV